MTRNKGTKRKNPSSSNSNPRNVKNPEIKQCAPPSKKGKNDPPISVGNSSHTTETTNNIVDQDMSINPNTVSGPQKPNVVDPSAAGSDVKKSKPVIVEVNNKSAIAIVNKLRNELSSAPFIKSGPNGSSIIECASKADKLKLMDNLKIEKHQFHTFTEKADKAIVFILKGLSGYNNIEVQDLLKPEFPQHKVFVHQLTKPEEHRRPVFRILFEGERFNLEYLQHNCRYLGCLKITWETVNHVHKQISQCFRCQSFNHVAKECNRKFRCVKCAGEHDPGMCLRTKQDDINVPLKCANCGGPHPANFRDCIKRKEALLKMKKSSHLATGNRPEVKKNDFNIQHPLQPTTGVETFPPLPPSTSTWAATAVTSNSTVNTPKAAVSQKPKVDQNYTELNRKVEELTQMIIQLTSVVEHLKNKLNDLQGSNFHEISQDPSIKVTRSMTKKLCPDNIIHKHTNNINNIEKLHPNSQASTEFQNEWSMST